MDSAVTPRMENVLDVLVSPGFNSCLVCQTGRLFLHKQIANKHSLIFTLNTIFLGLPLE